LTGRVATMPNTAAGARPAQDSRPP
jgi:hypothetical protein